MCVSNYSLKVISGSHTSNCANIGLKWSDSSTRSDCIAVCPSERPILLERSGDEECVASCSAERPFQDDSAVIKECLYECPTGKNHINIDDTDKICSYSCSTTNIYVIHFTTHVECYQNCPSHQNYVNPETNYKICEPACTANLNYILLVSSTKKCFQSCSSPEEYILPVDGENHCSTECDSAYSYFNNDSGNKNCVAECSQPKNFVIPSSPVPECELSCNSTFNYMHIEESHNVCYAQCKNTTDYLVDRGSYHECVLDCPTGKKLLNDIGTRKICKDSCPSDQNYAKPFGNNYLCSASCDSSTFVEDNSAKWCVSECDQGIFGSKPFTFLEDNHQICKTSCPTNNDHLVDRGTYYECLITCPSAINYVNTVSSNKLCKDQCEGSALYGRPSGSNWHCHSSCDSTAKFSVDMGTFFKCEAICDKSTSVVLEESPHFRCINSCPDKVPLIQSLTDYNKCVTSCPESDSFIKIEGTAKICTNQCPEESPYVVTESGSKWCKTECYSSSPYIVIEDGNKICSTSCSAEAPFTTETDKQCLSDCPDDYPLSDGVSICSDKCPSDLPFRLGNACRSSCPSDKLIANFSTDLSQHSSEIVISSGICLSSCSGYLLPPRSCLQGCPIDLLKSDYPLKKCLESCDNSFTPFLTSDGRCVQDCSEYEFEVNQTSCSNECLLNEYHPKNKQKQCLTDCPQDFPFSNESICSKTCPDQLFILNFKECVSSCPSLSQGVFCVEECDDPQLFSFTNEIQLSMISMPYIDPNRKCVPACTEAGFTIINEITNECISECPFICSEHNCLHKSLRYLEEERICRVNCSNPVFPFYIIEEIPLCLPKCPTKSSFTIEEEYECIDSCPKDYYILQECAGEDCIEVKNTCVSKCPQEKQYIQPAGSLFYCQSECSQWYRPSGTKCVLHCDRELGLIENDQNEACLHCLADLTLFMIDKKCDSPCPKAQRPNKHGVCKPCLDLGEWTYYGNSCHPDESGCDETDIKDYRNKLCLKCNIEGFLVVYQNGAYSCQRTTCSEGVLAEIQGVNTCFLCSTKFYYDRQCVERCPVGAAYDFASMRCLPNCNKLCNCCKDSVCQGQSCACKTGFMGIRCDISEFDVYTTKNKIFEYLLFDIENGSLERNMLLSAYDYVKLESSSRYLAESETLFTNLELYVKQNLSNFEENWLLSLDIYLLLGEKLGKTAEILMKITEMFDNFAFSEYFKEIEFKGLGFSLKTGFEAKSLKEVSLDSCIDRVKALNGVFPSFNLQFNLVEFHLEGELVWEYGQNINSTRKQAISVYFNGSKLDLASNCSPGIFDTSFSPSTSTETLESAQALSNMKINIFDDQNPIFIDKCVPFSLNGKDLTVQERRDNILESSQVICAEQSSQVCKASLNEEGLVVCECVGLRNKKKPVKEVKVIPDNNFILFNCLSTFKQADFLNNPGFYIITLLFLTTFLFSVWNHSRIYNKLRDKRRFELHRNDFCYLNKLKMSITAYFWESWNFNNHVVTNGMLLHPSKLKEEELSAISKALPTLKDIYALNSKEREELDNRTNLKYLKDSFLVSHRIVNALFFQSLTSPQLFRLLTFITQINMNNFLSAFLIQDSEVREANENGSPSLLDSMGSNLHKTLFAVFVMRIVTTFLKKLTFFSGKQHDKLEKRFHKPEKQVAMASFSRFMTANLMRNFNFILVVLLINLSCSYFCIIYCEIYRNSRIIWWNSIISGWIVDFGVVDTVFPLIATFFRVFKTNYICMTIFKVFDFILVAKSPIKLR